MLLADGCKLSALSRNYPWKRRAALSKFMYPFQKRSMFNNWYISDYRPSPLMLTWDNSEGPANLECSLWDQVKLLLRLHCRPFSSSVQSCLLSFLHVCWSWEHSQIHILLIIFFMLISISESAFLGTQSATVMPKVGWFEKAHTKKGF